MEIFIGVALVIVVGLFLCVVASLVFIFLLLLIATVAEILAECTNDNY